MQPIWHSGFRGLAGSTLFSSTGWDDPSSWSSGFGDVTPPNIPPIELPTGSGTDVYGRDPSTGALILIPEPPLIDISGAPGVSIAPPGGIPVPSIPAPPSPGFSIPTWAPIAVVAVIALAAMTGGRRRRR